MTTTPTAAPLGGTFTLPGTTITLRRIGYGAMQLAGPGVYGPPKDEAAALAVLREAVAAGVGATPMQVAQAWLLQRSPNILLIPGTSSLAHLRENLAIGSLQLPPEIVKQLDGIAQQANA